MYHNLVDTIFNLRERMHKFPTAKIAELTGVHPNTVRSIRNGVNTNPTIVVVQKIHNALEQLEQQS